MTDDAKKLDEDTLSGAFDALGMPEVSSWRSPEFHKMSGGIAERALKAIQNEMNSPVPEDVAKVIYAAIARGASMTGPQLTIVEADDEPSP